MNMKKIPQAMDGAAQDSKSEKTDSDKKLSESLNVNISASESDAFSVIMKLAGIPIIATTVDSAAPPATTSTGACMEDRETETEYANKPDEKYSSIRDITRAGKDLNRPKSQHADKAKLGDNPLATASLSEGLWKAYEAIKKQAD
jgi:hypothetical protein